jgi:hypothetical protein
MIDGIQVHARDDIQPTFRVPAVRVDYGYMEPAEVNANHYALVSAGLVSLAR